MNSTPYTIGQLIKSLSNNPNKETNDWLFWPPDVFAITSLIMEKTGCYRIALLDTQWWEGASWGETVKKCAEKWIKNVGQIIIDPTKDLSFTQKVYKGKTIKVLWESIMKSKTDIYSFRWLSAKSPSNIIELAKAIYILNTVADTSCAGIGLPTTQAKRPDFNKNTLHKEKSVVHCLANLLLVSTGSLSTLSKLHGSVFPKMRTPQTGMVLRSVSHHLTFHTTEVEVMWRTIPWPQGHQKSLNILAIPSPFVIHEDDFEAVEDQYHAVQYFRPNIKKEAKTTFLNRIVSLVKEQSAKSGQIHFLIFPEMALSQADYKYLLNAFDYSLRNEGSTGFRLPVIVTGVVSDASDTHDISTGGKYYFDNKVKIASYFAGRWYDASQRKHHRWQLDKKQVIQYSLQTKLSTERKWFEYTIMSQRRLTILAPNGWLAMTALVCEDLARLEPVSEIIRGIGPTFLTALLADGPQLGTRWAARYASVLADDPGTGVLSLTSYGMANRSKRTDNEYPTKHDNGRKKVVALWKDMINGTSTILTDIDDQTIDKNGNFGCAKGILLTVSAKYNEEYTLDGRSDEVSAAVFELENAIEIPFQWGSPENVNISPTTKDSGAEDDEKALTIQQLLENNLTGDWDDIRDLSLFIYTLDSLIDTYESGYKEFGMLQELLFGWWSGSSVNGSKPHNHIKELINLLEQNLKDPKSSGIDVTLSYAERDYVRENRNKEREITGPIDTAKSIFAMVVNGKNYPKTILDFYENLINESIEYYTKLKDNIDEKLPHRLSNDVTITLPFPTNNCESIKISKNENPEEYRKSILELRIRLAVPIAISMLIDNKLGNWKIKMDGDRIEKDIKAIKSIREKIKQFLDNSYADRILQKWKIPD